MEHAVFGIVAVAMHGRSSLAVDSDIVVTPGDARLAVDEIGLLLFYRGGKVGRLAWEVEVEVEVEV